MKTIIIYPNQIYKNITKLLGNKVILVQDSSYFDIENNSIEKLVYFRSLLKFYEEYLKLYGIDVMYYENDSYKNLYVNNILIYENTPKKLKDELIKSFKNVEIIKVENRLHFDNNEYVLNNNLNSQFQFFQLANKNLKIVFENRFSIESINYFTQKYSLKGEIKNYYPITFDEANISLAYYLREQFNKEKKQKELVLNEYFISILQNNQISLEYLFNMIMTSNISTKKKNRFMRFLEKEELICINPDKSYLNNIDYGYNFDEINKFLQTY